MKKTKRFIVFLLVMVCVVYMGTVFADNGALKGNVIRLHVVADSDSREDQEVKLQVKDAVTAFLQEGLQGLTKIDDVTEYLQNQLPKIEAIANDALKALGRTEEAVVTFLREAFPTRAYETFSLPAGVYRSLRITIGEGAGENWWCVVFPALCMQATGSDVKDVAAGAGFSGPLADTLTGNAGYELRFYFLELLGSAENFFHRG